MESVDLIATLEARVAERTGEARQRQIALEVVNKELEAFWYSVAHDLRFPLLTFDGFSQVLLEACGTSLDEESKSYLGRITPATARMGCLINDPLALSKTARAPMKKTDLNLAAIAGEVARNLRERSPERQVDFVAHPAAAHGDFA